MSFGYMYGDESSCWMLTYENSLTEVRISRNSKVNPDYDRESEAEADYGTSLPVNIVCFNKKKCVVNVGRLEIEK